MSASVVVAVAWFLGLLEFAVLLLSLATVVKAAWCGISGGWGAVVVLWGIAFV